MPAENVVFRPRHELLTFEEICRFVAAITPLGIRKVRLTGGEPLVRHDLPVLVELLRGVAGIEEIAMTTNGMLLAEQAESLRRAGLQRLNVSLDTLNEEVFQRITRRPGVAAVVRGIEAALAAGFHDLRLNALSIRGLTEDEIVPLVEFARARSLELRFIEFMPLDAENQWETNRVLTGRDLRCLIESHFGPLVPVERADPSQPAVDYRFADGNGRLGFINPVSEPFCGDCNRLRLTAEGQVRNCLFSTEEWDARALLRGTVSMRPEGERPDTVSVVELDEALRALVRDCVQAKKPGHGIDEPGFLKPQRAMYQIGG
jgi:cyclic pyranopterin phosphate synthase